MVCAVHNTVYYKQDGIFSLEWSVPRTTHLHKQNCIKSAMNSQNIIIPN